MSASDQIRLEVQQTELSYWATLEPPAFDLPAQWVQLQAAVHSRFAPFKLRLADIKVESATANPADVSIACWMLNYGAVVRFRLDRLEAWSNSGRLVEDPTLAQDIVEQAMAVVRALSPSARVAAHNITIAIHGSLVGDTQAGRVAAYVTGRPGGTPPAVPTGVSFQCEFPAGEGQGSIVFERSGLVSEGGFLRIMSEHAGTLSERDALSRGIEFFQASARRLGMDVVWRT